MKHICKPPCQERKREFGSAAKCCICSQHDCEIYKDAIRKYCKHKWQPCTWKYIDGEGLQNFRYYHCQVEKQVIKVFCIHCLITKKL